jgi:hypothetical protein
MKGHVVLSNSLSKISKHILSIDDTIDAVSIMDMQGNTLSSTSKESFYSTKYDITKDIHDIAGDFAIVILGMVQRMDEAFGSTEAIVSFHKKCKLMLVPIPSHQILIGLVIYRSSNEEYIITKIRTLLEDEENISIDQNTKFGT